MTEENFVPKAPDFTGDGVAVWVRPDKNGKDYLAIQLLGKKGIKVVAFKNEPKEKKA